MSLQIENGVYVLGSHGRPAEISGAAELAQNIRLRLTLKKGSLPMDRELGSGLFKITGEEEHRAEIAVSLASEALMDLPGVTARQADFADGGIRFTVDTPLGEMEVLYGNNE